MVANHSVGAHPDNTWCKKIISDGEEKQYVKLLEDEGILQTIPPQARIKRYRYESQWFEDDESSTVRSGHRYLQSNYYLSLTSRGRQV